MVFSKCGLCCERPSGDRMNCVGKEVVLPCPPVQPGDVFPASSELSGLSYSPPPPAEWSEDVQALLGTELPMKPPTRVKGTPPVCSSESSRMSGNRYPSCARPGEPVNQVFVQFSNDLEGFLPYTLVISEDQGLEFTSLGQNPDFALDPLNLIKVERLGYETLMRDAFFVSLSKSIMARPELRQPSPASAFQPIAEPTPAAVLEERVRPPYRSLVQLSVRRTLLEGGQVLVFIAVQSEPLAEELVRSCHQLKKRRAVRHVHGSIRASGGACGNGGSIGDADSSTTAASRGCTTPRTAASAQRTPRSGHA